MFINRATGCIEKQELDSGKGRYRVAGEQELLQKQRHGKEWPWKMVCCIINHLTPCGLHHIFVIRGWNLVYEVETEAAKLKSSG